MREEDYYGFPLEVRLTHHIHLVAFITIALSGFYIHNPINLFGFRSFKWIGLAHTLSAIFLFASFFFRLYYAFGSGDYVNFSFRREDFPLTKEWLRYYLFLRSEKPTQRKYNPLQKLTYYTLIFLLILQGLLGITLLGNWNLLLGILGGRQSVRTLHFLIALFLAAIVTLHIYLVFTTDQRLRVSMFTFGPIRRRRTN